MNPFALTNQSVRLTDESVCANGFRVAAMFAFTTACLYSFKAQQFLKKQKQRRKEKASSSLHSPSNKKKRKK